MGGDDSYRMMPASADLVFVRVEVCVCALTRVCVCVCVTRSSSLTCIFPSSIVFVNKLKTSGGAAFGSVNHGQEKQKECNSLRIFSDESH